MYIEKEIIESIRDRARIEDVVMRYVPSLKKKGNNYVGLCPFHKEKTPSFTVSPDKQIFHCFGCNAGGNVFSFISKIENLDFTESVVFLASQMGIEISRADQSSSGIINEIRRINLYALKYYNSFLKSPAGKAGMDYIISRGVSVEAIEKFKIGYSPDSWDMLSRSLKKNRADMSIVEKIGLSSLTKDKSKYIDRFRGRVMFPIFDTSEHVVAFGGRVLSDSSQPKYLNSPDSEVFHKRDILYGLNFAKESIRENDRVIVVEGYLDVIGCHQNGLENVVAPLGTALTENHIKNLSRLCNEIIMLFDSDSAGINAALKSIKTGSIFNTDIKVATLPEDDPFDYIQKKGVMELMIIIENAQNPVEFQIDTVLKNGRNQDVVRLMKQMVPVLDSLELDTEKNRYLTYIAQKLKINEIDLRKDYMHLRSGASGTGISSIPGMTKIDYSARLFRDLISLILHYPEITGDVLIDFSVDDIKDETSRKIYLRISELYQSENKLKIDKIFDFFSEGIEMEFLKEIIQKEIKISDPKSAYTEIYVNLKLHSIDSKLNTYAGLLKESKDDKLEYLAEIEILRREKEKLKTYIYNKG